MGCFLEQRLELRSNAVKVLVADDDATTRRMLVAFLEKWGYTVVEAADGKEALAVLEGRDPPRLAVLDWVMPEVDGIELCRRVRASALGELCYIILLTARDAKADIVVGLDAGANDYITKPFDGEELQARVAVGSRVVELQDALVERLRELEEAVQHIRTLQGILPICMHCHRIRDDRASWQQLEHYVQTHSEARFSHGLCPECLAKYYPEPTGHESTDPP